MPDVTKYENPFKDAMADLNSEISAIYVDEVEALNRIASLLDNLNTRLEALEGDLRHSQSPSAPVQLLDPYSSREG